MKKIIFILMFLASVMFAQYRTSDKTSYAGLSCNDVGETTIDYTDVWEKFILFDTDSPSRGSSSANATDNITVGTSGDYSIFLGGSADVAAGTKEFEANVFEIHASAIGGTFSSTAANPIVLTTSSAHGLTGGELVKVTDVTTADELNDHIYKVKAGASGSTLTLTDWADVDVDASGYGAGTGGVLRLVTQTDVHCHRDFGTVNKGVWASSSISALLAGDTIELYIMNVTDASNLTMEAGQMWIRKE